MPATKEPTAAQKKAIIQKKMAAAEAKHGVPDPDAVTTAPTREYRCVIAFGMYDGSGTANPGEVVSLPAKEAKRLAKLGAITAHIPDDEDEDD